MSFVTSLDYDNPYYTRSEKWVNLADVKDGSKGRPFAHLANIEAVASYALAILGANLGGSRRMKKANSTGTRRWRLRSCTRVCGRPKRCSASWGTWCGGLVRALP